MLAKVLTSAVLGIDAYIIKIVSAEKAKKD